jgi:sugar lactone lactonase YvrE
VHTLATAVHLSNGIDWSPDDRLIYYTDSLRRVIWAYDFNLATGAIANRRAFVDVPADAGVPDGLCVDAEGCVWSAHWGGSRVTRYDPDGRIERVIELPAAQITCPAFGGADLDTLYVSSAAIGLSAADFARTPDAGGLFALAPGVRGRAPHRFAA